MAKVSRGKERVGWVVVEAMFAFARWRFNKADVLDEVANLFCRESYPKIRLLPRCGSVHPPHHPIKKNFAPRLAIYKTCTTSNTRP